MRTIPNRKSLAVVTPQSAVAQLVSTADMKQYLRVDTSVDDTLIDGFVKTATDNITQYLRRALTSITFDFTMDRIHNGPTLEDTITEGTYDLPKYMLQGDPNYIELPFPPIQSITSIKTRDLADNESVFDPTAYRLDPDGRVYLNYGQIWPVNLRHYNAITIRFVAGYGFTQVPLPIVNAIKDYAATMYDCRRVCDLPSTVADSLSPYRILDDAAFIQ